VEVFDLSGAFVDASTVRLSVRGANAFDGSQTPAILDAFAGPRARVESSLGVLRITLDPRQAFASEAAIEVRMVAGAGASALESSWRFRVEDYRAPTLLAAEATSPTTIALSFDEPVSPDGLAASFLALEGPAVPLRLARAESADTRIELTVQPEMTPGAMYRVRVSGARDASGNAAAEGVAAFRGYEPPHPLGRRFGLWRMLPAHLRRADSTTDLARFIGCLQ
jgi:hypothetical protein